MLLRFLSSSAKREGTREGIMVVEKIYKKVEIID